MASPEINSVAVTEGTGIDTMAGDFTTTSATYVDVTDLTVSTPDGRYVTARMDSGISGAQTRTLALIVNSVTIQEITTPTDATRYIGSFAPFFSSGGIYTSKVQAKVSGGATLTVYAGTGVPSAAGSIIAYSKYAMLCALGSNTFPIKASVTTFKMLNFGVASSAPFAANGSEYYVNGLSSTRNIEKAFVTFTVPTSTTLLDGLSFVSATASVWILFDFTGYVMTLA